MLFADVRSSMELAQQVGSERWHALLERFFAILTEGVHRFEGTVNQYTGDGIMTLFGAPIVAQSDSHSSGSGWRRGAIIEHYPDDPRGSSCLILGHSGKQPIHVVCGRLDADEIPIIIA